MALGQSPSIVTQGLAFSYDMSNRKSFAGPPITNLIGGISLNGTGTGTGYSSVGTTELVDIPEIGPTTVYTNRIQNNYTSYSPTNNNCCPSLFQYGGWNVTGSTLYTYAIVYRVDSGYTGPNFMYRYEYNGGTYVTELGVHTTSQRRYLGDGWWWAWATTTTQPSTTRVSSSGLWYYQYSPYSDRVSVAKVLFAQGDWTSLHPKHWPESNTTRLNTRTIIDQVADSGITANSLTYSTNGSFSFGGSGYLSIANTTLGNGNVEWTFNAWVKTTTTVNSLGGGSVVSNSSGGPVYSMMGVNNGKIVYWTYQNGNWAQKLGVGTTVNDDRWHMLTWVNYNNYTMDMYVDGVLDSNVANSTSGNSNPVDRIGGSWNSQFVGSISNVSRYTRALSAAEVRQNYNSIKSRYVGSSQNNAAANALDILKADPLATTGLYWIDIPGIGPTQLYCDMTTAGGGWIHIGTFSDNNEASNNSTNHPWGYPLNQTNDTGIWEDDSTLGSLSLTSDYKSAAWSKYPMTQMLMKDQGSTQRSLFYTNALTTPITMSAFWQQRTWGAYGSDSSSSAYSGGRVYGLGITNFGVSDPVFDSSNKSIILFKYGEYDGAQDGNKDRTMIAWHRHNAADGVDAPGGIGCFTNRSGTLDYRDIIPTVSGGGDFPPANISNAPYNYTLWVR